MESPLEVITSESKAIYKKFKIDLKSIAIGAVLGILVGILILSAIQEKPISSKEAGDIVLNALKPTLDKEGITSAVGSVEDKGSFYEVTLNLTLGEQSTTSAMSVTKDGKYFVEPAPVNDFKLDYSETDLRDKSKPKPEAAKPTPATPISDL